MRRNIMKNLKLFKALSLAVILALLLSCFAGCGDKEKSGAGKSFNKKKPTATESGGSTASQDDTPDKGDEKDDTKTPSAEDKELEALKKMTSKQIGDEIFEEAFKVYFLFDGGNLDFENEDTEDGYMTEEDMKNILQNKANCGYFTNLKRNEVIGVTADGKGFWVSINEKGEQIAQLLALK